MDNIRKLREKVENDPKSTLFVPLAEEYKKAGQLDEAIDVLKAGIERQPAYMSARVSLGKIYLEKDMLKEAKEEFETVIKAIPDNLVAHRKLAEIGRSSGDREGAIRHYRKLVSLNSMDEDSQQMLQQLLAGGGMEETQQEEEAVEEVGVEAVHVAEDFEPIGAPVEELEELNARKHVEEKATKRDDMVLSLADKDALEEIESGSAEPDVRAVELDGGGEASMNGQFIPAAEEVEEEGASFPEVFEAERVETAGGEDEEEFGEIQLSDYDEGISLEELAAEVTKGASEGAVGQSDVDSMLGETVHEKSFGEVRADGRKEPPEKAPASVPQELAEDAFSEADGASKARAQEGTGGRGSDSALLSDADAFISGGDYPKAMEIYRRMLSLNPRDGQVLQRVEELKTLLRLLGRENEDMVIKLQSFLDAVKRRRDEFYGNS